MKNLAPNKIKLKEGFWSFYNELNRSAIVKNVYERFKETGRFDALKCEWSEGKPNKPHIYWDSDVVKWIEGVAYIIEQSPEPELEALADEMIVIADGKVKSRGEKSEMLPKLMCEFSPCCAVKKQTELN